MMLVSFSSCPMDGLLNLNVCMQTPTSEIIRTYAHLWGMRHDHAQTTWRICKHGQTESWNQWWCMTCSKCWRIQNLLQNAMHGKRITTKWWDSHYDLTASWLQNGMHHPILTRHILTKITTYRAFEAHHFAGYYDKCQSSCGHIRHDSTDFAEKLHHKEGLPNYERFHGFHTRLKRKCMKM